MSELNNKTPLRAPVTTVLLHWGLVLVLAVNLLTGLRISADAPDASVSRMLTPWLPQGDVLLWHLVAGLAVFGLMVAYALYQLRSGLWRRLLPWRGTGAGDERARRWRGRNAWLLWLAFMLLALAVITGLMQYMGSMPAPRELVETVHRGAAWGLVLFLPAHVLFQFVGGGLRRMLSIFLPRSTFAGLGATAAVVAVVIALGVVAADRMVLGTLHIGTIAQAPLLDGRPDDSVWQSVEPVSVRVGNGVNLTDGEAEVSVRGLHDGERVYLLVEWDDPTRSQKHVPLVKTSEGWRIQQTAFRRADETEFYEDKLALMLSPGNPLAALTSIHLGDEPLEGQPGPRGGRGLHYTTDGSILDVWHWKSVRNAAQRQADDNFFGPALPAPKHTPRRRDPSVKGWFPRYTAGYRKDPPGTYSGYEMNWEFFDENISQPLRLPKQADDFAYLRKASLEPDAADAGDWWMEYNESRPYLAGEDDMPIGSVLPSVVSTGPLTGDRGDIRARGYWSDGRWHLEMSRRLDTGSNKDVAITDGALLWVAVFDHSQTRHAYHLRPLRIRITPGVL